MKQKKSVKKKKKPSVYKVTQVGDAQTPFILEKESEEYIIKDTKTITITLPAAEVTRDWTVERRIIDGKEWIVWTGTKIQKPLEKLLIDGVEVVSGGSIAILKGKETEYKTIKKKK